MTNPTTQLEPTFKLIIQVEDARGNTREIHKSADTYWTLDDVFEKLALKISKFEAKHKLRMQQQKAKIENKAPE